MIQNPLYFFGLFILGLCFGSFATVLTYRVPRRISIIKPSSFCPNCNLPISKRFLIPLIGYVFERKGTTCCKNSIDSTYLWIEISTTFLFLFSGVLAKNFFELTIFLIVASISAPIIVIDQKFLKIPNAFTYFSIIIIIAVLVFYTIHFQNFAIIIHAFKNFMLVILIFTLLAILSKGGIGLGDLKLAVVLAVSSSFRTVSELLVVFILAFALAGSVATIKLLNRSSSRISKLAFGPYLLIGFWTAMSLGPKWDQAIIHLWLVN